MRHLLMLPIWLYRRLLSPLKPACCRFVPTCSDYAMTALHRHGVIGGVLLSSWRLMRCQPFAQPGHDPVPETFRFFPRGKANASRLSERR